MFFERFNNHIIEEFAIRTIAKSFDCKYKEFILPCDKNNFDGISPDNCHALEVTLVVNKNNLEGYTYEKLFAQGKRNLKIKHIKDAKLKPTGELLRWSGGTIQDLVGKIQNAIIKKDEKARKRLKNHAYTSIDLCLCIDDGSLFDLYSFQIMDLDLKSTIFNNIFFITANVFVRFSKETGFEQYEKITT